MEAKYYYEDPPFHYSLAIANKNDLPSHAWCSAFHDMIGSTYLATGSAFRYSRMAPCKMTKLDVVSGAPNSKSLAVFPTQSLSSQLSCMPSKPL